jgi:Kdo2-lipid IVA lauroyltransferase/acyltransferase
MPADGFPRMMKMIARNLAGWLISGLIRCVSLLDLASARRLGKYVGRLLAHIDIEGSRTTRTNIERCFPELALEDRQALVRESLEHTGMFAMEAGMLWHWPVDRCEQTYVSVEGAELITRGLDLGKGVLLLVPHLGNWEVLSLFLGRYGYTCLYDPPRIAGLESRMVAARSRTGGRLVPLGIGGVKTLLRALRSGELVVVLPDQVPERQGGVHAPFFNQPALTMTLTQKLLRQTGAQPVFGAAIRLADGFGIRFSSAPSGVADPDPVIAATALNRTTEALVREHPAQYQWEYRRFKRPPPGTQTMYRRRNDSSATSRMDTRLP